MKILRTRRIRLAHLIPGSILATQLIAGITLASTLPEMNPTTISGTVQCASGEPVVGIWVHGVWGGSGWAHLQPQADNLAIAKYAYVLAGGGPYFFDVGCGGTKDDWKVSFRTGRFVEAHQETIVG